MKAAIQRKPAFLFDKCTTDNWVSRSWFVAADSFSWGDPADWTSPSLAVEHCRSRGSVFLNGCTGNIAFRQQVLEPWMKTLDFLHPTSHQFACEQEIVLFLQSWHFLRISCSAAIVSCNRLFSLISIMSCCILGTFKFAKHICKSKYLESRFAERQAPTPKIGTELLWSSSHSFWHCITLSLWDSSGLPSSIRSPKEVAHTLRCSMVFLLGFVWSGLGILAGLGSAPAVRHWRQHAQPSAPAWTSSDLRAVSAACSPNRASGQTRLE